MKRSSKKVGLFCITELVLVFLITHFLILPGTYIPSASMEPTINSGSIGIMVKGILVGEYERRDIVVFIEPDTRSRLFCKRVIGLPGDTVAIISGKVYINGVELSGPSRRRPESASTPPGPMWTGSWRTRPWYTA